MPKQHQSILQALPSQRVRVGDSVVDVAAREITTRAGASHRVSLKAIDLLLVLIDHAGKVVSRDSLLETVWPDTLPGDDVVTQAVAHLRKAFDSDEPYIETIAKHGYRLLAPVEWLDVPAATDEAFEQPAPSAPETPPEAHATGHAHRRDRCRAGRARAGVVAGRRCRSRTRAAGDRR